MRKTQAYQTRARPCLVPASVHVMWHSRFSPGAQARSIWAQEVSLVSTTKVLDLLLGSLYAAMSGRCLEEHLRRLK